MNVKYIILGKTGYIAKAISKELNSRSIPHATLSRSSVDYTDPACFDSWMHLNHNSGIGTKSATIINCAGFIGKPNVDACEDKLQDTLKGNVLLPHSLLHLNASRGQPLVHISSGCIYNGYEKKYTESCPSDFDFNNGSVYSGTKAMAETVIRDHTDRHYIFRLRIPFDHHKSPRNYITKMLSYDTLLDAENSMSNRSDFAKAVIDLLEMKAPHGTYNITNPGSMTTSEVVELIKKHISPDREYKFFTDFEEFYKHAKAPRSNCVLDTTKIESLLKITPLHDSMEQSIMKYT